MASLASRLTPYHPPRALWNVLLAGLLLRFLNLGGWSLWLDEGATWSWAVLPTWKETLFAEANHPPVWWLVTRGWIEAFGDSESALRAPAAICSLLSLGLLWVLLLRLLDPALAPRRGGFPTAAERGRGRPFDSAQARRIAAWTVGLVAVGSYFLEYAQEARMYALLAAEALGLCLLYLRWLDRGGKRVLVAYALLGAFSLYTHYFAVWILFAHAGHALWLARPRARREGRGVDPRPLLAAVVAAGLLFVPRFLYLALHFQGIAHIPPEPLPFLLYILWRTGVGPALAVPDRLRQAAGPLSALGEEWPIVVAGVLFWMLPLAAGIRAIARRTGLASFVAFQLLVPVVLLLLLYPLFPLLHERYFLFVAPWFVLLAVLGAFSGGRFLRPVMLGGLVLLTAVGTVAYVGSDPTLVPDPTSKTLSLDGERVATRWVPDPDAPPAPLTHGHAYGRGPWRGAHA
ncbi:MAG: hypothetical protein ACC662_10510, partial [Planctomycetota bacterium]